MITEEYKLRVIEAIQEDRLNYPSASKQAVALGVSASQLSKLNSGKLDKILSDAKWMSVGRRLDVTVGKQVKWAAAKTPTFEFIYDQLKSCKENSVSALLCDAADIGKTFTAKYFAREHKHTVCIDSSQVKSKQKFVRKIAREFGVINTGRYADVYADLVYYLQSVEKPLVIVDEAGDLDYPAFLELKALWNATEGNCGWYMMGADGLKAKIESNLDRRKVGYTEIFSRFGSSFQKVSPEGKESSEEFHKLQMALVAKVNLKEKELNLQGIYTKTGGSLRKLSNYAKHINKNG